MKNILFIGGSGQLGSAIMKTLTDYSLFNISHKPHQLAKHIPISRQLDFSQNSQSIQAYLQAQNYKFQAIIVTAGGWTGGTVVDKDYADKAQQMIQANYYPCLLAAHLASKYLSVGGLVIFCGSYSVYQKIHYQMLAYSLAKNLVHELAKTLAQQINNKQIFKGKIITILPETLDTKSNRQAMPNQDFNNWAKLNDIAEVIRNWIEGKNTPSNGSYHRLHVQQGHLKVSEV